MMNLKDAKVGDRVLVYLNSYGSLSMGHSGNSKEKQIPTTVLNQTGGGTTLGWKAGECMPVETHTYFDALLEDEWKKQGFVQVYRYGSHCLCQSITELKMEGTPLPTEGPCRQCGRMNDIGIGKCWCCEVVNPTP